MIEGTLQHFDDLPATYRRLGNAFALSILAFLIIGFFLKNFAQEGSVAGATVWMLGSSLPAMFILSWSGWRFAQTLGYEPRIGAVCGFWSPIVPLGSVIGTIIARGVITSKLKNIYGLKNRTLFGFQKREIEAVRLVLEQQASQHNQ